MMERETFSKETLFIAYIDGTLDREQAGQLERLLADDPAARRELLDMKDIADSAREPRMTPWETERRFADLMHAITGRERGLLRLRIGRLARYAAVAAVAALAGVLGTVLLRPKPVEKMMQVAAAPGNMTEVTLPDGTRVALKSASTLCYDIASFGTAERRVHLDGEAYFDVTRSPEKPFVVETLMETVRVHGTTFNLQAYRGDSMNTLVLLEGRVSVDLLNEAGERIHSLAIHPGEKCTFHRESGEMNVEKIAKNEAGQAWDDNIFYFRDQSLREIAARLEQYFQVRIDIAPALEGLGGYSGAFSLGQGFDEILRMLDYDGSFTVTQPEKGYYLLTETR